MISIQRHEDGRYFITFDDGECLEYNDAIKKDPKIKELFLGKPPVNELETMKPYKEGDN